MTNSDQELALTLPKYLRVLMSSTRAEDMKLETYLAGVIAAQIGTTAPLEALKAQAVASRTYAVVAKRHPEQNADMCIQAHCQKWKRVDPVFAPEVFRALSETWGLVAMHEGSLINAVYFEHCDGHTRNSEDMLLPETPYLRSVECSCGLLTLKGHGVGMCIRGAIMMARRGATFEQILQHYYRGIQLVRIAPANESVPHLEETKPIHAPVSPKPPRAPKKSGESEPKPDRTGHKPGLLRRPEPRVLTKPVRPSKPKVEAESKPPEPSPVPPPPVAPIEPREPVVEPTKPPEIAQPIVEPQMLAESVHIEEPEPIETSALAESIIPAVEPGASIEPIVLVEQPMPIVEPSIPIEPAPVKVSTPVAQVEQPPAIVEPSIPIEPAPIAISMPIAQVEQATIVEPSVPVEPAPIEISTPVTPVEQPPMIAEPSVPAEPAPIEISTPVAQVEQPPTVVEPSVPIEPPHVEKPALPFVIAEEDLPELEENVVKEERRYLIDQLPGARMIAGCAAYIGMPIVVEDAHGNKTLLYSGNAPHYGEGGFETFVAEDGAYWVTIGQQTIEVSVHSETVFIHAE